MGRARRPRIVDRHDLVELGRGIGIERDRRGRRDAVGAAAHVGNDDLVAEPVHLGERRGVPIARIQKASCAYMAETPHELPAAALAMARHRRSLVGSGSRSMPLASRPLLRWRARQWQEGLPMEWPG